MKTTTYLPLPTSSAFGGALNKRKVILSILCLIIVTLWNTHSVTAAPAKLDSLDSTFPLDLQPPIFEATSSATSPSQPKGNSDGTTTIDSYGNPIESLQPIQTPDGRKVVSAEGLQFEIPNYASGITELKKPADDLLPPFVGEFSNEFDIATSAKYSVDDVRQSNDDKPGIRIYNNDNAKADKSLEHVNTFLTSDDYVSDQLQDIRRYKRQLQFTTHTYNNNFNDNSNAQLKDELFTTQNTNTFTNNLNAANTTATTIFTIKEKRLDNKLTTNTPSSINLENSLNLFDNKLSKNLSSLNLNYRTNISSLSSSSSYSPRQYNNSFQFPSFKTKLSAHYTPLSNGNFNFPNVPTDASIIERIVSKYKNPLPTLDPIVVALPDTSSESFSTNPGSNSSDEAISVDVESVPLVETESQPAVTHNALVSLKKDLPDYILELNDPDIGGPVDYEPTAEKRGLSVLAWDLLPPLEVEDVVVKSISHSNKVSLTTGHNSMAHASQESSHTTQRHQTTNIPNYTQYRGGVSFTSTATSTTTRPRTTTTTRITRTTTKPSTTTTTNKTTTTPRTTTTTTTTPAPDSSEFFKLEAGDSYTLPLWLQDIDDPDLDVAVTFEIPEDINEYNHTIASDLLPPLEPYIDLNNIHLTAPTNQNEAITTTARTTTTTTTTRRPNLSATTTTRRPNLSTIKPHWVRARPTSPKPTIATFNNQFTSLKPFSSSLNFAQRTTSTTSTTVKPKTTINFYNRQLSSNIPQTDKIGSSGEDVNLDLRNPFLSTFNDGKYKPQSTTRRTTTSTTTTTTTTTTTPAPEIVEKNPFEPTIPPWLKDFDYPDIGPGVPFIYEPNEYKNPVDENILPPAKTLDTNAKSNPPSTSPLLNSQTPQGFTNKFTSSAIPSIFASSSSIPSIVTIPLPSKQTNQDDSTFTQQPFVFVPPTPNSAEGIINADKSEDFSKQTSSTFNTNFAAPFDPTSSTTSVNAVTGGDQKKVPLSAERESFPPFNNIITGSSTTASKTTFSKSEDGKVITTNIFLNGGIGPISAKPIASTQAVNSPEKHALTTQSSTGAGLTTSASASGFVTASSSSSSTFGSRVTVDGSRYSGRFGGPPGVLAPQVKGFTASNATTTQSYSKPPMFDVTSSPGRATNNNYKFTGSFGGPPGILKPYDNVKNR